MRNINLPDEWEALRSRSFWVTDLMKNNLLPRRRFSFDPSTWIRQPVSDTCDLQYVKGLLVRIDRCSAFSWIDLMMFCLWYVLAQMLGTQGRIMADYRLLVMVIKSYWKLMLLEDSMQWALGMQYASECNMPHNAPARIVRDQSHARWIAAVAVPVDVSWSVWNLHCHLSRSVSVCFQSTSCVRASYQIGDRRMGSTGLLQFCARLRYFGLSSLGLADCIWSLLFHCRRFCHPDLCLTFLSFLRSSLIMDVLQSVS